MNTPPAAPIPSWYDYFIALPLTDTRESIWYGHRHEPAELTRHTHTTSQPRITPEARRVVEGRLLCCFSVLGICHEPLAPTRAGVLKKTGIEEDIPHVTLSSQKAELAAVDRNTSLGSTTRLIHNTPPPRSKCFIQGAQMTSCVVLSISSAGSLVGSL